MANEKPFSWKDGHDREKYLFFSEKTKGGWAMSKPDMKDGFRPCTSLKELDKLAPRKTPWRITAKGGLTYRTDEQLLQLKKDVQAHADAVNANKAKIFKNKVREEIIKEEREKLYQKANETVALVKAMRMQARNFGKVEVTQKA